MNPEYSTDIYDRYAAWILAKGPWTKYIKIKKHGFMNLKTKEIPLQYESFPVDTISLWKATNRSFAYTKDEHVSLSINNNNHVTLYMPERYKNTQAERQIVARELGFVCMNVRSHLLPDNEKRNFTKKDLVDAHEQGGLLGKIMMGVSVVGLVAEQSAYQQRKERELDEAWKVATAILIPISAYIYVNKQKILKNYNDVSKVFNVSSNIETMFLKRIVEKYDTNTSIF